jgi:hypothetical protein
MNKITVSVPVLLDSIISQLPARAKLELTRKLELETRSQRWVPFLKRISAKAKNIRITEEEVVAICKQTRKMRNA